MKQYNLWGKIISIKRIKSKLLKFLLKHDTLTERKERSILIKYIYSPGCSLTKSKPMLGEKAYAYLNTSLGNVELYAACCRSGEPVPEGTVVINTCPGCDETFDKGVKTITLWEIIDSNDDFPFPRYDNLELTIQDACPMRKKPHVHEAVRKILGRMNIKVTEAVSHGEDSVCCGFSYKGELTKEEMHNKMKERTSSMPLEDVCVYCMGCFKAMTIGGGKPLHLADLLFGDV